MQGLIDQIQGRGQSLRERIEGRLALRQRLGVAHELEARVDAVAQHVGQIVQVQRGQVARLVLHAQRAKSPGQRVTAFCIDIHIERLEARSLGQEGAAANAVRQRRVAPLQISDDRCDRRCIALELLQKLIHLG